MEGNPTPNINILYLMMYVITNSNGAFQIGYFIAKPHIYDPVWVKENHYILLACPYILIFCGVLVSGYILPYGRRKASIISAFLLIFSCIPQMFSKGIHVIISRFIEGFFIGIMMTVSFVYNKEIAPRSKAISTISSYGVFFTLGEFVGYSIECIKLAYTGSNITDICVFAANFLQILVSFVQILLYLYKYTDESPMFLIQKNFDEEAMMNLGRIYADTEGITSTFYDIKSVKDSNIMNPGYFQIFGKAYRKALIMGSLIFLLRNWSAYLAYITLLPFLLSKSNISTFLAIMTGLGTLTAVAAMFYIDRFERRKIFTIGYSGALALNVFSLIIFIFADIKSDTTINILFTVMTIFTILNWSTYSSLTFGYGCELLPEKGVALLSIVYIVTFTLQEQVFIGLSKIVDPISLGIGTISFFILNNIFAIYYARFHLYESYQKTNSEILHHFAENIDELGFSMIQKNNEQLSLIFRGFEVQFANFCFFMIYQFWCAFL